MWSTGNTYNLSSGMTVTGEQVPVWGYLLGALPGHTYQHSLVKLVVLAP